MTQEEIQDLIKFVAKSGVNEVEIERKDFKITIKSPGNGNKRGKGGSQEPQLCKWPCLLEWPCPCRCPQPCLHLRLRQRLLPAAAPAPAAGPPPNCC